MNDKTLQKFIESTISDSAIVLTSLGIDLQEAYNLAKDRVHSSLPHGINTQNHFFFSLLRNKTEIGDIWYFNLENEKTSFLANIKIVFL